MSVLKVTNSLFNNSRSEILLMVILILAVFARSLQFEFVNWDDQVYVIENLFVRNLSFVNLGDNFTNTIAENYQSLTIL